MNGVQKILSAEFTKSIKKYKESIKKYKDIQKLIDPLVKKYFEIYCEEWQHFSDWDFDDMGENIIINYSYLDYNDDWEYNSIDISLDKIIEMI